MPSTSSLATVALASALAALGGCASLNTIDSDVSSYSQWPADRKPGSYTFERLPSQQANPERQGALEMAARGALTAAGFSEADPANADVSVQVGARITRYERAPYYDPFWRGYGPWGGWGGWGGWGWGRGPHLGLGMGYYDVPSYSREVALLIRDRKSGSVLYETRASSEGGSSGGDSVLAAMFDAAMKDFPQAAVNPRRVSVQMSQ
jgi:hypothetical protein